MLFRSNNFKEIKKIKNNKIVDNINNFKNELNEIEKNKIVYKQANEHIDIIKNMLSDNGIKSSIIKNYLPFINNKIKYYLDIMEININFQLDENFNEKINKDSRNFRKFEKLSIGEKARINFAILFSFIELSEKRNNTKFSFILLDEILENGLDKSGKEIVIEILKHNINKKVILITHDDAVKELFDTSFEIEKEGYFSKIRLV